LHRAQPPLRIVHRGSTQLAATGARQRLQGALAAICHRADIQHNIRQCPLQAAADGSRHLRRRQAALE